MLKFYDSKRIAIYGIPRTGTTSLIGGLGSHPEIKYGASEPFASWRGKDFIVKNREMLETRVNRIFSSRDIIKFTSSDFPPTFIYILPNLTKKLIVIRRKNILKQAISISLARQTKIWQSNKKTESYGNDWFEPIDLNVLNKELLILKKLDRDLIETIKIYDLNPYMLVYEDFYLSGNTDFYLKNLFEYLEIKYAANDWMSNSFKLSNKLNTERTYLRIPNIYEIEKTLGNNETGWVFEGGFQL